MSNPDADPLPWLLAEGPPWARYRALVDLLDRPEDDPEVAATRRAMLAHPQVQELLARVAAVDWTDPPWTALRDARMPFHVLGVLADFGLRVEDDQRLGQVAEGILSLQDEDGGLRYVPYLRQALTCLSAPALYPLVRMGLGEDPRVRRAVAWTLAIPRPDGGWDCRAPQHQQAPLYEPWYQPRSTVLERVVQRELSCPQTTLDALRVLVEDPELRDHPAVVAGARYLLSHWARREEPYRPIGFGAGRGFQKLKYPFIWYHILKVADVLSRIPAVHDDTRFREIVGIMVGKGDERGRFRAESVYRAWADFDFGQKKEPSRWITLLVLRILRRQGQKVSPVGPRVRDPGVGDAGPGPRRQEGCGLDPAGDEQAVSAGGF